MQAALVDRPTSGATPLELCSQLRQARARTRELTQDLSTEQLMGPMLPVVNPILWEIGHVGWFHEYWTLRHAHGVAPLIARADRLWNSSTVAHDTRWELDLPDRAGVERYLDDVLERQLDRLAAPLDAPRRYFYELAIRHEDMHVEALAYTRQTLRYGRPPNSGPLPAEHTAGSWPGDAEIPGGKWRLGSSPCDGFVFDNEKWQHEVALAPFRIAKSPVTNGEFAAFIEEGGYGRREFWSAAGWAWREQADAHRPVYWLKKEGAFGWTWRRYDKVEPLAPDAPVTFINWYEAQAFCNWAKRRLPSEAEWEAAALGEPDGQRLSPRKRPWPWGGSSGSAAAAPPSSAHANLDFACNEPADVGGYAAGDSAFGCRQMIGNVWEWTASDFAPFAGFSPDPYEDYSQPWFNSRKVLRGGSFATSTRIARATYRNFFMPDRNDVIAGFRTCAL